MSNDKQIENQKDIYFLRDLISHNRARELGEMFARHDPPNSRHDTICHKSTNTLSGEKRCTGENSHTHTHSMWWQMGRMGCAANDIYTYIYIQRWVTPRFGFQRGETLARHFSTRVTTLTLPVFFYLLPILTKRMCVFYYLKARNITSTLYLSLFTKLMYEKLPKNNRNVDAKVDVFLFFEKLS